MNAPEPSQANKDADAAKSAESRALLRQAQEGDMDAFATLFESLRPVLHRVAYRLVGPDNCDDVVMDSYLKLWQALPSFRGRSSLKTWSCTVLRNCALDALRKQGRQRFREVSLDAAPAQDADHVLAERIPDPSAESALGVAERGDQVERLRLALASLSEQHRQIFLLREADGLSYRQIAEATGIATGTVMSRLFYAKRRLQAALKEMIP